MRPSTMVLVTVLMAMLVVPMAFIDLVPEEGPQGMDDYPTAPPPPKRQPEAEPEPEPKPEPEPDQEEADEDPAPAEERDQ